MSESKDPKYIKLTGDPTRCDWNHEVAQQHLLNSGARLAFADLGRMIPNVPGSQIKDTNAADYGMDVASVKFATNCPIPSP